MADTKKNLMESKAKELADSAAAAKAKEKANLDKALETDNPFYGMDEGTKEEERVAQKMLAEKIKTADEAKAKKLSEAIASGEPVDLDLLEAEVEDDPDNSTNPAFRLPRPPENHPHI